MNQVLDPKALVAIRMIIELYELLIKKEGRSQAHHLRDAPPYESRKIPSYPAAAPQKTRNIKEPEKEASLQ